MPASSPSAALRAGGSGRTWKPITIAPRYEFFNLDEAAYRDAARELADTWFFETIIRLHRAAEGAPFTGLKPAGVLAAYDEWAVTFLNACAIAAIRSALDSSTTGEQHG